MPVTDDHGIREILTTCKIIALLGASPRPDRPSNQVMRFLQAKGYKVIPVNPGQEGKEINGEPVCGSLSAIESRVDMVDVFRSSEHLPAIVEEVLAMKSRPTVLWTQLGVIHTQAAQAAEKAGLKVVMNRCPAIDFPRLIG